MSLDTTFDGITLDTFNEILAEYDSVVPPKLHDLDHARYIEIPNKLQAQINDHCLSKDDLVNLVTWKTSHGKFRPTLKGLAQQNSDDFVREVTQAAFNQYASGDADQKTANAAIKSLSKLKGVGPATAALLLSVHDPVHAPFFSDELFRWAMADESKGWDREIKYSTKEYSALFERAFELRERFREKFKTTVTAVDAEKVAYVLGKRASGVGSSDDAMVKKRKLTTSKADVGAVSKAAKVEKAAKPKLSNAVSESPPSRRSTRTRK